jgi:hemoglobin
MKFPALLILAGMASAAAEAQAQVPSGEQPVAPYAQSDANAGAAPLKGDGMFKALHGLPGIDRVVAELIRENQADPRTADFFHSSDTVRLHRTLVEQLCYLAGGPCRYTGMTMAQAHVHMGVQTKDFDAVVEHLERALDIEGVPFRDQAKLLAKLAPMKRVMVDQDRN